MNRVTAELLAIVIVILLGTVMLGCAIFGVRGAPPAVADAVGDRTAKQRFRCRKGNVNVKRE